MDRWTTPPVQVSIVAHVIIIIATRCFWLSLTPVSEPIDFTMHRIAGNIGGNYFGSWTQNCYCNSVGGYKFGNLVQDHHMIICE